MKNAPYKVAMNAERDLSFGRDQWLNLGGLSLLWGSSYLFFKVLAGSWGPLTIVMGRVGVAAIFLIFLMSFRQEPLPRGRLLWSQFAILGLLNNVIPFSLVAVGIRSVPSAMGAILNIATPVLTVLVAHFLTRDEKITRRAAVGVLLAAAGVLVLLGPTAWEGRAATGFAGQMLFLAASLSFAFAAVFARRIRDVRPMALAMGQLTASTLLILPFCLMLEQPWTLPAPDLKTWGALFGISVLSSGLAYILFFRILSTSGAAAAQLVTFLIPVVAIILGGVLLQESLPLRAFLGMLTIASGLLVIRSKATAAAKDH